MKKNTALNIVISSGKFNREKDYWLTQLAGDLPLIHFPYDSKFPEQGEEPAGEVEFRVPAQVAERLLRLSNQSDKRLLMALIAGVEAILYRYTSEQDLLILTPVERQPGEQEYLNTALILRNSIGSETTYKALLLAVKETLQEAERYQNFPYGILCELLETTAVQLLHVGVVLENLQDFAHLAEAECEVTFVFRREGGGLTGRILYDPNRYHTSTITQLSRHLNRLMEQVMTNLDQKVSTLPLLSDQEWKQILVEFNPTQREFPDHLCVHQLFEEQVSHDPNQIAVEVSGHRFTYLELNQAANRIAQALLQENVQPEQMIAIMAEPSFAMISGLLGIWKAGCAYLPIDPTLPLERIRYFLNDSGAQILLCQSEAGHTLLHEFAGRLIWLEQVATVVNESALATDLPSTSPDSCKTEHGQVLQNVAHKSTNLAYVLYTSGSTGQPKGVMVEHRSVVNMLVQHHVQKRMSKNDREALFANYSFDASLLNIFSVLTCGGTLVVTPPEIRQNPSRLVQWLREEQISVIFLPTRMGELVMQDDPDLPLRLVYVGGEKLNAIPAVAYEVFNEYGPTENTVTSINYQVKHADLYPQPPIGRPIDNVEVYILDQNRMPVPINVVGELYLAGVGLARGYWNQPALTAERFLPNPYKPGSRMYKTGDLGRWLPDGNVEFIGRTDFQVKIRGFRIEIGEIEALLNAQPEIREAIVLLREVHGEPLLTAYLVAAQPMKSKTVRELLRQSLPPYMVPTAYLFLDALPVTEHGKIDRRALLQLAVQKADMSNYVPPTNPIEEVLCKIWADLLQVEQVGIEDHFLELGGHSLKAATLITEVHRQFQVELALKDIFTAPTIRELAVRIADGQRSAVRVIEVQPEREYYPVSSAQKRLFILRTFEGDQINYNMPGAMRIHGPLERERFEAAIQALIQRHDSLRTHFSLQNGQILQQVEKDVDFTIEYHTVAEGDLLNSAVSHSAMASGNDGSANFAIDSEKMKHIFQHFVRPFDLGQAPLLRVALYQFTENEYLFLSDMHHIISDGISMSILQREFIALYNGQELEPLPIQYKDYAIWQNELIEQGNLQTQEAFWLKEFAGEIPVLALPADFTRPVVLTHEGGGVSFTIPAEVKTALHRLARQEGASLFLVLLALYAVFLTRSGGQEEVVIGVPADGRPTEELRKLIGMFVNTLPLRLKPERTLTFSKFLREASDHFFHVLENQDYQFEMLIDKLKLSRDHSRNPLFDTMLTVQNWDPSGMNSQPEGLQFQPLQFATSAVKMDLVLHLFEGPELLHGNLEYNTNLFLPDTVERMVEHFTNLITEVAADPEQELQTYRLISEKEKYTLLYEFNHPLVYYPDQKITVAQYLEEQVHSQPERIAVMLGEEQWSYGELNQRANQLARILREKGVRRESIVAMMVERSLEMLIGLFAIFKAGGAYLPIDPRCPVDRIRYTLRDSHTEWVLTQQKFADRLEKAERSADTSNQEQEDAKVEVICLDRPELYTGDSSDLSVINQPADLAYVIYTSGSTGKPKGVMIEHRNMVIALLRHEKSYPIGSMGKNLHYTPYIFDASVYELFGWVMGGGSIYLLGPDEEKDPATIFTAIEQQNITHAHFVPSMLNMFLNDLPEACLQALGKLQYLFSGGEALTPEIVKKFFSKVPQASFYNIYGPTEVTIDATDYFLQGGWSMRTVPIGKPLENVHVYILDETLQLQPIGVPGEICIGGLGVGRGYLNRPELTEEKFIPNPHISGERIYRSGDLGRWLPDGNIEFFGRMDHQVKVRGFRIELGEIESLLQSHEAIQGAVVINKKHSQGDSHLTAYFTSVREFSVSELQHFLKRFLPEYMIPTYFIRLDSFPFLPSGKIDRQALPEPGGIVHTGVEYVAPRSELERELAGIWKTILGLEQVGIHDSFFQLGGTSLSIIRLFEKMKEVTEVPITVANLFSYHTIAMCAEYLQTSQQEMSGKDLREGELDFEELLARLANDEVSPEEAAQLLSGER